MLVIPNTIPYAKSLVFALFQTGGVECCNKYYYEVMKIVLL